MRKFNEYELNIIYGALNCYLEKENLPEKVRQEVIELKEEIKKEVKHLKYKN